MHNKSQIPEVFRCSYITVFMGLQPDSSWLFVHFIVYTLAQLMPNSQEQLTPAEIPDWSCLKQTRKNGTIKRGSKQLRQKYIQIR
jgi:hypothetical protein